MRIRSNLKRIINFLLHRRRDIFSPIFAATLNRLLRERFFYFRKLSNAQFLDNLKAIAERPWNLHVELSNICNADCIFCAYHLQKRKKMVMTDSVYDKTLLDYIELGGGELRLETCLGDPLTDEKFIRRVKQARAYPDIGKITVLTNGINLDRIGIDEFLSSGIDEVGISCGPWDEQLYKLIYRSNDYQRMRRNVSELLRKNAISKNPIAIKLLFRSNLSMRDTLELADYQQIKTLPHEVEFNTDFDTWLGVISQPDLLKGMRLRPKPLAEKEPCYWLYDGPIVFSDGTLGLCGCRDFNADSELISGNILQKSLKDMWRSDKVSKLRERFWQGEFPAICARCTAFANLDLYRSKQGKLRAEFVKKCCQAIEADKR